MGISLKRNQSKMLFSKVKSKLGIDIGSSNIKIAELQPKDDQFVLNTYGLVNSSHQIDNKENSASIKQTGELLKNLISRAGVTTSKAVASLPNNSVFTSVIEIPKLPESELKAAVEFEAKKYVPLPLAEVALSWSVVDDKKPKLNKDSNLVPFKPQINRIPKFY